MADSGYTVPGMDHDTAADVIRILDDRMVSLIDLALTLKHVHWNVVGPGFIAVHEMLDPQVDAVRDMIDQTAERIAALGGIPVGTPGALVARRAWEDYDVARALVPEHLIALERVYSGIIGDHRGAQRALADPDPVSEDLIISQLRDLEQFQWFIRAHLENAEGKLRTDVDDLVAAS
jgi:starvation-inducible DNA-binding protein